MKKSKLLFSICILLISSLLISCDKYEKKLNQSYNNFSKRQSDRIKKINLPDSFYSKYLLKNGYKKEEFVKFTEPMKNEALARAYIEFFKKTAATQTMMRDGIPVPVDNTESIWIDKETIKAFAKELMDDSKLDGIRIYYSRYLDVANVLDPQLSEEQNSRQTLILVATQNKINGSQIYHEDYYKMPNDQTTSLYIYDYNSLCPPNNNCVGAKLGGH